MSGATTILIIDDDPDAISYLEAVLEDNGYETVTAADGDQGLDRVREAHPDLVLLDLLMPEMSGTRFLNEIKRDERLREIPVVVQSGAREVTGVDMRQYLEEQPFRDRKKEALGVDLDVRPDGFLEKPVDRAELLATLERLL